MHATILTDQGTLTVPFIMGQEWVSGPDDYISVPVFDMGDMIDMEAFAPGVCESIRYLWIDGNGITEGRCGDAVWRLSL